MGFIRGRIHPPPENGKGGKAKSFYLEKDEMDKFMKEFVGKPVCVDHELDRVIGRVLRLSYGKFGEIMADLYVDESLPESLAIMERVRIGELKCLSFRYKTLKEEHYRYGVPHPTEISVVVTGAVKQSRIELFGFNNRNYVSESGVKELHTPPINHVIEVLKSESDNLNTKSIQIETILRNRKRAADIHSIFKQYNHN